MSERNPSQLPLIGSLAGYVNGENVQYPAPAPEAEEPERTLEAEAALGQLLMQHVEAPEAVQEPLPDLFDEIQPIRSEPEIPHNIIRGEE